MKLFLPLMLALTIATVSNGQAISIHPRSALVLKGNVQLVIKDAALINNGRFTDSESTIKFIGQKDSSISYLSGSQTTSIYNLSVDKTNFGTALRSTVFVRNVLGVYGGILYPDSNLVLRSDSNLTARVDVVPVTANIIGKSTVERYYPKRRAWRLVTAPLTTTPSIFDSWQNKGIYEAGINTLVSGPNPTGSGGNGLDPSPQNNPSMKTWNSNTQVLAPVLNTKVPLSPGTAGNADNVGYFLFVRGDRDINNFNINNSNNTTLRSSGQLQTGTQTFPVSSIAGGYTMIGNPFASPVDFNATIRTNLVKRFYVWDPALNIVGGYVMLDDLDNDGIFTKSVGTSAQNNHLQSSQAFFVQTQNSGAASISFLETSKSAGNNSALFRPLSPTTIQTIRIELNRTQADSSLFLTDEVLLECNENFKDSVDADDALKFTNINECIGLVRYGNTLTAERRPLLSVTDTLFLKISRATQGNYQFKIAATGIDDATLQAFLEDSYLQHSTTVDLAQQTNIDFAIDGNAASAATNRFRIVFKQLQVLPVTFVAVSARQQQQQIIVTWKVNNEVDIIKYDVERSLNVNGFIKIGSKNPVGNNPLYQFTDEHPASGNNFYRIKSYDATGAVKYSAVVKAVMGNNDQGISIYPNPVTGNSIHVQLNNLPVGNYHFRLIASSGQVLHESDVQNNSAGNSIIIAPSAKLPAATYQLEITNGEKKTIKQIMITQ